MNIIRIDECGGFETKEKSVRIKHGKKNCGSILVLSEKDLNSEIAWMNLRGYNFSIILIPKFINLRAMPIFEVLKFNMSEDTKISYY